MKFLALAAVAQAVKISGDPPGWNPDTLPTCPDPPRTLMDDRKTHVVKYPYVGATCKMQIAREDVTLVFTADAGIASDISKLEHCPDFDERMTLKNGKTRAVPYPNKGYNCNNSYA